MSCLNVSCKRVDALHIECSLVCTVGNTDAKYLRVSPTTTQWVTPYEVITYDVESNTSWRVE